VFYVNPPLTSFRIYNDPKKVALGLGLMVGLEAT